MAHFPRRRPALAGGSIYAVHVLTSFAQRERHLLCDLFERVGPDAPTLCAGWNAYDLAAHLWVRETEPLALPGVAMGAFSAFTEGRMRRCRQRHSFSDLVELVRNGPAAYSLFALPGVDAQANALEYFVHHEDVRRAVEPEIGPRALAKADSDLLWKKLPGMGALLLSAESRKAEIGIVVEHRDATAGLRQHRLRSGTPVVILVGEPGEIWLWLYGRRSVARIELIGTADAVALLGS